MTRELAAPPVERVLWTISAGGKKLGEVLSRTWFAARAGAAVEYGREPGELEVAQISKPRTSP